MVTVKLVTVKLLSKNVIGLQKINKAKQSISVLVPHLNPLSANPTKWSNTFKQYVGKFLTNCLSAFDHFVGLALKGSKYLQSICSEHIKPVHSTQVQPTHSPPPSKKKKKKKRKIRIANLDEHTLIPSCVIVNLYIETSKRCQTFFSN